MGGPSRSTLREVARRAGVHPATASRALNPATRSLVREATARRVEEAARQLRYEPDPLARSLKTRRSATVAVLVPDLTNTMFPPIVSGVEDRLAREGYVTFIANTDSDPERERRIIEEMRDRIIDGLVVATASRHDPFLSATARSGLPVVLVNRVVEGEAFSSVCADDEAGARAAVAHLVSLGHRRIGHIAGPGRLSTGHRRELGFVAGTALAGLDPARCPIQRADRFSEAEGYRAARALLGADRTLGAIVAGNDALALGCLRALAEAGLSCPGDVSLVGFNDSLLMDRISPPLTTLRLPHFEIGAQAAELLLARIADPSAAHEDRLLVPELIVRASSAPPRRR